MPIGNYTLSLDESVAPESCTVLDIASVIANELIGYAIYINGQSIMPADWIDTDGERINDVMYEAMRNEAYRNFTTWAGDMRRFYNGDKVKAVIHELMDAAATISYGYGHDHESIVRKRYIIQCMYGRDFGPMMLHWKNVHTLSAKADPCTVEGGMDYVTAPPK